MAGGRTTVWTAIRMTWPLLVIAGGFGIITCVGVIALSMRLFNGNGGANIPWTTSLVGLLMIVGSFGVCALGFVWLVVFFYSEQRAEESLVAQYPNQPWQHRPDWAKGYADHHHGRYAVTMLVISVVWNAIATGATALFVLDTGGANNPAAFYGTLVISSGFVLIGLALGGYALWLVIHWAKLSTVRCRLIAIPFRPGGFVRCLIEGFEAVESEGPIEIALDCKAQRSTRFTMVGKELGEPEEYFHYFYQARYVLDQMFGGLLSVRDALPIRFYIPAVLPPAACTGAAQWELRISWPTRHGWRQELSFELPVFQTDTISDLHDQQVAEFDQQYASDLAEGYPKQARVETLEQMLESYRGSLNTINHRRWHLSLPRNRGSKSQKFGVLICAVIIFGGAGIALGGIVGIVLALIPAALWWTAYGDQRLSVDGETIRLEELTLHGWRPTVLSATDIDEFAYQQAARSPLGLGMFQVVAKLRNGSQVVLLTNAYCMPLARRICNRLKAVQKLDQPALIDN